MMKSIRKPSSARYFPGLAAAALGLFALGISTASCAALRAQLDRATVQEGRSLTLTIESDGAQSGKRPDVTPLRKDFDVLGTSTSSETKFVNGSRSDHTRWLVQLQPRRTGTIDIPPISVGSEQTAALELNVTEASPTAANEASEHVFLEAEAAAAGKPIYVQQQIPYTIRLYYDDTLQTGELAPPNPADAIVEQLGEEKRYTARRNGREYNVIERRYAVAPEKSGALHIPAASFRGSVVAAPNGQGSADPGEDLMDRFLRNTPFANDPIFKGGLGGGSAFGDAGQPVAVRSQEIRLTVLPRPAAAQGNWLPAEQVTLHDSWEDNPPQFKVGVPATRTITVDAKGLAASQIPSLSLALPTNARLYPEASDNESRTDDEAIYGASKQSVTYIPTAQGTLTIPPVELAWWNARSNTPSLAALPAREFRVEAGAAAGQSSAPSPIPVGAEARKTSPEMPMTADHPRQSGWLTDRLQKHWPWVAAGAGLLAMMILWLALIRRSRRRGLVSDRVATPAVRLPRKKDAIKALHHACVANDRRAAAAALLDLARAEWPDDPPRGLSALAARLGTGGPEILALDRRLYGVGGSRWEGDVLWNVLRHGLQPKRSETIHEDDGLGALYR